MRRLLLALLVLAGAFAAWLSGIPPFEAVGALVIVSALSLAVLGVLLALALVVHAWLFERPDRWHRMN